MGSSSREEIVGVFDALDAVVDCACELSFDALTTPERLRLLDRLERVTRRLLVPQHALINQLTEQADDTELGARLPRALADRLHITRSEANRRVAEAADLGPRRALSGESLPPLLTATADAQRAGHIGASHVQVIRTFVHRLPGCVDIETREKAEAHLARLATRFRPEQVARLADRLTDCLNPDGEFSDEDRARRRGLTLTTQDLDGMSRLSGWITPELRATLEAIWAKLAAPGRCNPGDQTPIIDEQAGEDAIGRDTRSNAQGEGRFSGNIILPPRQVAVCGLVGDDISVSERCRSLAAQGIARGCRRRIWSRSPNHRTVPTQPRNSDDRGGTP